MKKLKNYRYKNISIFVFCNLVVAFLFSFEFFHNFLLSLGGLGYLGAFLAGILFVSTFTVTIGLLVLLVLAENLSPIEVGLLAGFGAVFGDLVVFHYVRTSLVEEIKLIYDGATEGHTHLRKILNSRYFSWTIPVAGALIIASPLPDELGVSLLGLSKMKTYQFIFLSFVLNSLGVLFFILAAKFVRP